MQDYKKFTIPDVKRVSIDDTFWSDYQRLVREVVIPYQWEALNDRVEGAARSGAVENFKIAAGLAKGDYYGMQFQDTDVAKWLETVAYSLAIHPDAVLEATADEMIAIIGKAQQPDGYLDTYFIVKEPNNRWTNLQECHELYCAGHMLEAAVAYYQATGKRALLDIMCKNIEHIATVLGPEPEKLHGYPGHPEIELALMRLYQITGEERHLRLCEYFINERGRQPHFFDIEWERRGHTNRYSKSDTPPPSTRATYNQSHKPVREQEAAVGHAVRALYLYAGMAALAGQIRDESLIAACKRLWANTTRRQMYITGGVGSTNIGEAFTFDYDLPNDLVYAETCASIALIFFAQRMLEMELDSEYADVMERALYNTVLSSMARDGKHFFYVNPLEVWPQASAKNPARAHVKSVRQAWFGCACCPPNVSRLLTSLGQYLYTASEDTVYCHLYVGSKARLILESGEITLTQQTDYPWDGKVRFTVSGASGKPFTLALRKPSWCRSATVTVNGKADTPALQNGYLLLTRTWQDGDTAELALDMPVTVIEAHPQVRANAGRIALTRGPLVYCLEEMDNGANLPALAVSADAADWAATFDPAALGGAVLLTGKGTRTEEGGWADTLYRPAQAAQTPVSVKAVPYYLWGNRGEGEMQVWIRKV